MTTNRAYDRWPLANIYQNLRILPSLTVSSPHFIKAIQMRPDAAGARKGYVLQRNRPRGAQELADLLDVVSLPKKDIGKRMMIK